MGSRLSLLLVCAVVVADAFAADPTASEADQPSSQPSLASPPQAVAPSIADPSAREEPKATPPDDPSSNGKSFTGAETGSIAASPATAKAQIVANKPGKRVLVDDTVNDAQLRQILARGYKPEAQARGNEVYYCRGERELGSRFEKKICKTATRILQDELNGKEETARLERTSGNPAAK